MLLLPEVELVDEEAKEEFEEEVEFVAEWLFEEHLCLLNAFSSLLFVNMILRWFFSPLPISLLAGEIDMAEFGLIEGDGGQTSSSES